MSDAPLTGPEDRPIVSERGRQLPSWLGPALGLFIMGVMIVLGGLYLWGSMLTPEDLVVPPPRINDEPETVRAEADVQVTDTVSPSTEIDAIEADISSSLLDTYEADLRAMDAEIETYVSNIERP